MTTLKPEGAETVRVSTRGPPTRTTLPHWIARQMAHSLPPSKEHETHDEMHN